jgi:hypothetical protein
MAHPNLNINLKTEFQRNTYQSQKRIIQWQKANNPIVKIDKGPELTLFQ